MAADFNISYQVTVIGNEGGLNPGNGEAFTYRGIDESQNPNWHGFALVHSVYNANKHLGLIVVNRLLAANEDLQKNVQAFYLANYWHSHCIDKLNDQQVANNFFDCTVNPCIDTASMVFQKACNEVISQNNLVFHPLHVDGDIGPLTIVVANQLNPELLFNSINTIRKANYQERVVRTPSDKKWLNNWLGRLLIYKK